jgi:hypothetical protein
LRPEIVSLSRLGGIDPLNYLGDVFTAAVFEADVFDGMVGQTMKLTSSLGRDRS